MREGEVMVTPEVEIVDDAAQDEPLTPKEETALQALLTHSTLKDAARAANIGETTLWRIRQNPAFARRLREAQRAAMTHTLTRLQRAAGDAVTVLEDVMKAENTP